MVSSCGVNWYYTMAAHTGTFYGVFLHRLAPLLPLEIRPTSHLCSWPPNPESQGRAPRGLTEGRAPAGVMFVQIVTECVPAAPHTHHHVVPEDLQGARVRWRAG